MPGATNIAVAAALLLTSCADPPSKAVYYRHIECRLGLQPRIWEASRALARHWGMDIEQDVRRPDGNLFIIEMRGGSDGMVIDGYFVPDGRPAEEEQPSNNRSRMAETRQQLAVSAHSASSTPHPDLASRAARLHQTLSQVCRPRL